MAFYIDFIVRRNGRPLSGVQITYLYKGSRANLSADHTDQYGKVRAEWTSVWEGREVDVYFDGAHKRKIRLNPRDSHSINLPGGCFSGDTPILTPTGERAIASIAPGELVMALNRSGRLQASPVIHRADHAPSRLSTIHLHNGRTLRVTETHRMLTSSGYRFVADLGPGDRLISAASSPGGGLVSDLVSQVQFCNQVAPVSNLVVAAHYNFVAAGVVAHCFSQAPALQRAYWTMLAALRSARNLRANGLPAA